MTFLDFILVSMFVITGSLILLSVAAQRLAENDRMRVVKKIDRAIVNAVYPVGYAAMIVFALFYFSIIEV